LNLAELLVRIGSNYGCSAGAVAVAWTLLHPAVTAAIVGMRKPEQVDEVLKSGDVNLNNEDIERINAYLADMPV
jgi:aryl-alcohol dehydrogenase-like predicted oxidoreductase